MGEFLIDIAHVFATVSRSSETHRYHLIGTKCERLYACQREVKEDQRSSPMNSSRHRGQHLRTQSTTTNTPVTKPHTDRTKYIIVRNFSRNKPERRLPVGS